MIDNRYKFWRRLAPLALTQFLGIFNDHAFKTISVLVAVGVSNSYSKNSAFLAILTIVYVLPFLTFSELAGYFADKFPKRNVMVFAKIAEFFIMACGIVALKNVPSWGISPLVAVMFLMAAQSAFFSPSFNGIMPETFSEKELSHANGNIGMINFVAVILGSGSGFVLKSLVGGDLYMCGFFFTALSAVGIICALKIRPGAAGSPEREWHWNVILKYYDGLKTLIKKRSLLLAMLGESYFFVLGTAVQALLITYAIFDLKIPSDHSIAIGLMQFILAFGIGFGCWLAGRFSANKVELGLVPFGAAGLVIFLILTALCPGHAIVVESVIIYPAALIFLAFLGVSGGLFVVPLRAYQQQNTDPGERGNFFANANMICFAGIMLSGIMMFLLTAGAASHARSGNFAQDSLSWIQSMCFSFDPSSIILALGIISFFAAAYIFWLIPEFAVRFLIIVLTHTVYKLRVRGAENIPEKGPALLVANHVSFVDGLLITSCTSRFVHFMMHEDYYRYPLLYPFVKWAGFIEVPSSGKPKRTAEMIRETRKILERGEVVCIFPEGKITRNGIMNEFKKGMGKILPKDIDVPIIPVRMGMLWGSIFSYYYGKIKLRMPKELPHPASVTIGRPAPKDTSPFRIRQILSELAAETEMEPRDEERPLHYRFAKRAKFHPFKKTLKDFDGAEISNLSLFIRAAILSREIKKMATKDDKYVGVMLPNTSVAAISILGVMLADKIPAILNFTASKETLAASVEKADLNCILTSRKFLKKANIEELPQMIFLEDVAKRVTRSQKIWMTLAFIFFPHQEIMNYLAPETHRDVFKTAVLLFSSGSTGAPKGVMLSHHNINSNVYSCLRIMGWSSTDKIVGNLPLFHSFGITTNFWIPLMTGAKVVYLPNPLDGAAVGRAIEENNLTILLATPTFLQSYMRKCSKEQLKSLRLVITGAEKLRKDIAEKFKSMTGLAVVEGYGCTELSPIVAINVAFSIMRIGTSPGKPGCIGPPMPGMCVRIGNPETWEELPPGEEGLLLVKGPNVMQGYLKDQEKTADVIRDLWYNTGDIAKMDLDGYITITGRLSRFSKIGGEMVPHEMVEKAIYEILQSDKRCVAVCGAPDKSKGEKLVVIHTCDMEMKPEEIIEKLRQTDLPNLWMPRASSFYEVFELPLLGSGKLDLAKITELARELASDEKK